MTGMIPGSTPQVEPNKQCIWITFSPKEEIAYKDTYHLQVYKGFGFKIRFEGQGIAQPAPIAEEVIEAQEKPKTPKDGAGKSKTPTKTPPSRAKTPTKK